MRKVLIGALVVPFLLFCATYYYMAKYRLSPATTEIYSERTVVDGQGQQKHIRLRVDIYAGRGQGARQIPVVLVGGGGWSLGLPQRDAVDRWISLLKDDRFRVFSVEYRSVDCGWFGAMTKVAPEHSCFPHPARMEDMDEAVAYLKANADRLGIDANKLIFIGDSSGAHTAALYSLRATRPGCTGMKTCGQKIAGVVSFAGPLDLRVTVTRNPTFKLLVARLLKTDIAGLDRALAGQGEAARMLSDADPATALHPAAPPFLLLHSQEDVLVPVDASRAFRDAALRALGPRPASCGGAYDHVHKLTLPQSVQRTNHALFYAILGVSRLTVLEAWLPAPIVDQLYLLQLSAGWGKITPAMAMIAPVESGSTEMRRDLSELERQTLAWMACRADSGH
jgi:acetyl esterase/lipase